MKKKTEKPYRLEIYHSIVIYYYEIFVKKKLKKILKSQLKQW